MKINSTNNVWTQTTSTIWDTAHEAEITWIRRMEQ